MSENNMEAKAETRPPSYEYVRIIGNTTYQVQSNYGSKVKLIDLLKQMIQRDIQKIDAQ